MLPHQTPPVPPDLAPAPNLSAPLCLPIFHVTVALTPPLLSITAHCPYISQDASLGL
jgi:hypothetical protein